METSIVSCVPMNQKPWCGPPSSQKMDKLLISFLFFSLLARMCLQPASTHLSLISQEAYKNWFLNYLFYTRERWRRRVDDIMEVLWRPVLFRDCVAFVDSEEKIVSNPVFGNITGSSHTQPDHKPRRSSQSFPTSKPLKPKSASFATQVQRGSPQNAD